jgi:O-antigen ligase
MPSAPPGRRVARFGCGALAVAVVAAQCLVDPGAEAAFDAPKRLAAMLGIAIAATAVALLPRPFAERGGTRAARAVAGLAVVAAAGVVIAALASPRASITLDSLRRLAVLAVAVPVGASALLDGPERRWILAGFVAAATVNAGLAVLEHVAGLRLFEVQFVSGRGATGGLVGNEGQLAVVLSLAAVAALAAALTSRRRIGHAVALGVLSAGLGVTGNVTALLATGAGSAAVLVLHLGRRAVAPLGLVVALMLVLSLAVAPLRERASAARRDVRAGRYDALTSNRLGPWAAAVEMARGRPLAGHGPGTFAAEFVPHRVAAEMRHRTRLVTPVLTSSYGEAHCEPLQAAAEWGMPAGLAATAAVLLLVASLWRRPGPDGETLVLAGVLTAAMVAALTWFPFQQASTAAPLLLALGRAWRRLG